MRGACAMLTARDMHTMVPHVPMWETAAPGRCCSETRWLYPCVYACHTSPCLLVYTGSMYSLHTGQVSHSSNSTNVYTPMLFYKSQYNTVLIYLTIYELWAIIVQMIYLWALYKSLAICLTDYLYTRTSDDMSMSARPGCAGECPTFGTDLHNIYTCIYTYTLRGTVHGHVV